MTGLDALWRRHVLASLVFSSVQQPTGTQRRGTAEGQQISTQYRRAQFTNTT